MGFEKLFKVVDNDHMTENQKEEKIDQMIHGGPVRKLTSISIVILLYMRMMYSALFSKETYLIYKTSFIF